ncbi:MAG: Dps family protein [Draconibacterium sp.]
MDIGLKNSYKSEITGKLNSCLSSVQITYMNVRGYHWNIVGKQFFALHAKFEEIYDKLNEMADEIAERILMLDEKPLHAFSEYLKVSAVKERMNVSSAEDTINALLEDTAKLLKMEREILLLASENNDDGTAALMSGFISDQEKMIWMFNALLK